VKTTRILLADDQPLARAGLRRIIDADAALMVVGEATDGVEAVSQATALRPDIILMDVRMPLMDGIEATRRLLAAENEARVVILTTFGLDEYVVEALRAGARAFVLKEAPPESILAAITRSPTAARSSTRRHPTVIDQLAPVQSAPASPPGSTNSPRENARSSSSSPADFQTRDSRRARNQ